VVTLKHFTIFFGFTVRCNHVSSPSCVQDAKRSSNCVLQHCYFACNHGLRGRDFVCDCSDVFILQFFISAVLADLGHPTDRSGVGLC